MTISPPPHSPSIATLVHTMPERDWVLLQLGPQHSEVWRQLTAPSQASAHALALGYTALAQQYLKHQPPSEGDVEMAIMVVEDAVMPLAKPWPHPHAMSTLACAAGDTAWLAQWLAGSQPAPVADATTVLPIYRTEVVEDCFNQFASTVMGGPARGFQPSKEQAATLVIVRECLHHWGLQSLVLLARP